MTELNNILDNVKLALQDAVLDENNVAGARYTVGDETWKVNLIWENDGAHIKLYIRRRD